MRVLRLEMERREAEESWCDGGLWSKLFMTTFIIHSPRLTHNDNFRNDLKTKTIFIFFVM